MITLTLWQFLIVTLAAYRISYAITREEGPFGIFTWLRGLIDPNQKTWLGRGLNCTLCVAVWVTGAGALLTGATWFEWLGMAGAIGLWREYLAAKNGQH